MAKKQYLDLTGLTTYDDEIKAHIDGIASGKANSSHNHAASNITSGTLSSDRLPTVPITKGGTGATTAAGALTNLGLTATAAELNKMDGVTATTAEINYIDGVTSNIQTQLDGKAPNSHASTATTYGIGTSSNYGHVKLSDSTSSTSSTSAGIAATPAAVKAAYDLANGKADASHNHSGSEITSGTVAAARLPNASSSAAGIVSTGSQTLAGAKTFSGKITASSGITTGGDIVSDTANTDDVGSTSIPFANMYTKNLYINPKSVSGSVKFYGSFAATTEGTTTTDGYTELKVGNNTPTGSEGNARGLVQIYNSSSGSVTLEAGHSNSTDYRVYLPSAGGTLALNSTFGKSGSTAKSGLVPAPSTTAGTTKYLREDGTWQVPPDTNTTYSSLKNPYSLTIQGNGTTLTNGTYDGSAAKTVNITPSAIGAAASSHSHNTMGAASSSAAGSAGFVPAPASGKQSSFLRGDGTWATPTNTKNTAGSTNSSSKLFLIGATSQAANPQTYSHDTAYVGTDGCLYSGSKKVVTGATYTTSDSNGNTWTKMETSAGSFYTGTYTGSVTFSTAASNFYRPASAIAFTPNTVSFSNGQTSIDLAYCNVVSVDYYVLSGSNGVHDCYISDWNENNCTFSVWPWGNTSKTVTLKIVVTLFQ